LHDDNVPVAVETAPATAKEVPVFAFKRVRPLAGQHAVNTRASITRRTQKLRSGALAGAVQVPRNIGGTGGLQVEAKSVESAEN
jgi:hypothetical protein